jgi:tetratricopeptide (TPR) repeat protein
VAAYSYVMLGRIRQFFFKQTQEAVGYFESAENVHRKTHPEWRRYLHDHDWWWISFPNDFYAHWGAALMDAQEPSKAIEKYVRQIKYNPRSILGYIGLGNALAEMARKTTPPDERTLKAALEVYCYAALENRFDTEIRYAMADFLERNQGYIEGCPDKSGQEDRSDARKYALVQRQKTVDLMPTEPRYGLTLGRSLRTGGKHQEAIAAFNQVLSFSGQETWDAYAELATTFTALDQDSKVTATYQRAYGALSRAAAQRPFDAEVRYHTALALLRLGEYEEAKRYAADANVLDPSLSDARLALACAEKHLNKADPARSNALELKAESEKMASLDESLQACVADMERSAAGKTP